VYVHSKHFVSKLIQGAQWLRWRAGAQWNHELLLVKPIIKNGETVDWIIIQAATKGVSYSTLLTETQDATYAIVSAEGLRRDDIVAFAEAQVGVKYGFLTLLSIAVNLYTPTFIHLDFQKDGTWICSALTQEATRFGGRYEDWRNIYSVSPAQSWMAES
jgi:hypothetical protein